MNALEYIRKTYGVDARRGKRIIYTAQDGEEITCVIVGGKSGRLRAKIENDQTSRTRTRTLLFHPTWNLTYL